MIPIPNLLTNLRSMNVGAIAWSVVDVALVAYFIYRLILLAKGKRAWFILIGLGVFFLMLLLSEAFPLMTVNWILRQVTPIGPVAILVLFYPELREVLEKLGRAEFWGTALPVANNNRTDMTETIDEVVKAVGQLSPLKIGALIVMEREAMLDDIIATGTHMDAEVSAQLLATIFHHGTPLHDGAVVIRNNRIVAAECRLPLSEAANVPPTFGHLRHRAALGMSEQSDAVVIAVSEERGTVTVCVNGKQPSGFSPDRLRQKLLEEFGRLPKPSKQSKADKAEKKEFSLPSWFKLPEVGKK